MSSCAHPSGSVGTRDDGRLFCRKCNEYVNLPPVRLLGLAGRARSGKDTVAEMIYDEARARQVLRIAQSEPLKRIVNEVFGWYEIEDKETPDPRYGGLTPRRAYQRIGTEGFRALWPDIWIDLALRRAARDSSIRAIITDVRFLNEAAAIRKAGGRIWRIRRQVADRFEATHQSEAEVDDIHADATIDNDGSLDELRTGVVALLHTEGW